MNDTTNNDRQPDRDEATMARLLRLAGPRSPVPRDVEQRVYENVRREWLASSQPPDGARVYARVHREWTRRGRVVRLRRWALPTAAAATLLLAVAVLLQPPPPVDTRVAAATVARATGGSTDGLFESGQTVYVGDTLSTGEGQGLALLLNGAESMRIDENTTLLVQEKHAFELVSGRVYADTGDFVYRRHGLVIDTPMGLVTDVGTQFDVAIRDDSLKVAVREGRVDVTREDNVYVAVAGERMRVRAGEAATVDALAPHDAYWDWAVALAPAYDIENKSLLDFLRWASRETGRELYFETDELRLAAMRVDLHGSVAGFTPLEAVESVLAGTKFRYRIEAGRIVISQ